MKVEMRLIGEVRTYEDNPRQNAVAASGKCVTTLPRMPDRAGTSSTMPLMKGHCGCR